MTKESLHPGLGSGALREALAELQKLLGAATVRFTRDHGEPNPSPAIPYEVVFACEQWTRVLNQMVRALSLSSPIEPARPCNAPNPNGSYFCNKQAGHPGDHVHSFINPDKQNDFYFWPAQASSEIRERLGQAQRTAVSLRDKIICEASGYRPGSGQEQLLKWVQEVDSLVMALNVALASRQGAGGK